MENFLLCKGHSRPLRNDVIKHYVNYEVQSVDGENKLVPSPVVHASLAAEFSAPMNAVTRPSRSSRSKRVNVDAVDLQQTFRDMQ